jgi:Ca2+-binding RTX toxin-like protein
LGAGADLYVGNDYPETVDGASSWEPNGADTEVDVFDTHGGDDRLTSGSGAPGVENDDVISTGTGRDTIIYRGAAGGAVDNGPDSDVLFLSAAWPGDLTIDNRTRRASVGTQTALSWTAVDSFSTRVDPESSVSFHGTNADEELNVSGTVLDLAMPTQIVTGGGDDRVGLENYLPANVGLGDGYDTLTYLACHRAYVALAVSAECLTAGGAEVSTALAGVEYFHGSTADGLTVQGSDRAERISALARYVLVYGGPGADRVFAFGGRITQVNGGRGDDRIKGVGRRGVILNGGRGADVLRGDSGPDQLHGDLGQDVAWGQRGKDECDAEVRHFCE